ncbi:nitrilase-related carbon-nitrogen hydrolase, partial [Escherichia coli]|nr:nitrilase-related carbon-nitrogen hydrolase [Escherichia coli]
MSEKRIVRAAAVQISPNIERSDGTLNKVCEAIDQAAREGVQLMVFPETFVPYYPYFSFVRPPV